MRPRLSPSRRRALLAVLPLAAALSGCETFAPKVDVADTAPVRPAVAPAPVVNNGAIFQPTAYRPLFEDHRARLVGDTITVQIVEKVAASQKSTSSVDKSGTLTGAVTALPFFSPNSFNRASASGSSSNSFEGKGTTESANTFSGTITATVTSPSEQIYRLVLAADVEAGTSAFVRVISASKAHFKDPRPFKRIIKKDAEILRPVLAKAGKYPYICTVKGHAAAGMKGVLTVK